MGVLALRKLKINREYDHKKDLFYRKMAFLAYKISFWTYLFFNSHAGGVKYNSRWRVVSVKTINFYLPFSDIFSEFSTQKQT